MVIRAEIRDAVLHLLLLWGSGGGGGTKWGPGAEIRLLMRLPEVRTYGGFSLSLELDVGLTALRDQT